MCDSRGTVTAEQRRLSRPARLLILLAGLSILLSGNYFLRYVLEDAENTVAYHHERVYKIDYFIDAVYSHPWYELLLPIKEWEGTWTSTSFVLMYPLGKSISETAGLPYAVFNMGFVLIAVLASYAALRSLMFSLTLGACAAFTTFNYHVYAVPAAWPCTSS